MRYGYLVDLRSGISVFAIFWYGIAELGTPQCPPPERKRLPCRYKIRLKFPQNDRADTNFKEPLTDA